MYRLCSLLPLLVCVALAQSSSPDPILKQALTEHQSGDLDGAIRDYGVFLKSHPNSFEIRSNLGAALAQTGRYKEAIETYQQALKLQPGNQRVALNLSLAYYKAGEMTGAVNQLQKLHQLDPDNTQVSLLLADSYLRLGENKKVIDLLKPMRERAPDDLALVYMLGTALIRDNQVNEGQLVIDRILKNGDSAEARLLMGTTKLAVNDFSGAREDLARAVELNPKLPEVNGLHGVALMSTGDTAAAADAFRNELAQNPYDFTSNLQLGALLRQDQELDKAMACFEAALRVRPGDPAVRYQIATLHVAQGKIDQARTELEQLVKETPKFTEAHVTLATTYYRLKRKSDGDRERMLVQQLNAEQQATQPGVKPEGQVLMQGLGGPQ